MRRLPPLPRLSSLQHPTERREGRGGFERVSEAISNLAASSMFFIACSALVLLWVFAPQIGIGRSDLAGGMSALTLLLLALLENSERRAERAMQRKLDAIATALLADRRPDAPDADHANVEAELETAVRLHEEL